MPGLCLAGCVAAGRPLSSSISAVSFMDRSSAQTVLAEEPPPLLRTATGRPGEIGCLNPVLGTPYIDASLREAAAKHGGKRPGENRASPQFIDT